MAVSDGIAQPHAATLLADSREEDPNRIFASAKCLCLLRREGMMSELVRRLVDRVRGGKEA